MATSVYQNIGEFPAHLDKSSDMMGKTGAIRIANPLYPQMPITFESNSGFSPSQISTIRTIIKNNPDKKLEFWDRGRWLGSSFNEFSINLNKKP